jgi:hypothetical protein
LVVAGSATVMAGLEITHFRKKLDQVSAPNSFAKPGSGRPSTSLCSRAYVRFWHKADISRLSSNVRFWG